jgi:AmmeMemoRadiSam system protein B
MIRRAAVAGQFYPAQARQMEEMLREFMPAAAARREAIAVVVPHAGWVYSGHTAGKVYSEVTVPDRVILIGPNHRGTGSDYALWDSGRWEMPLGSVPVAEALAAELLDRCELLVSDSRAHEWEHSLEVQVPMLARANPQVQIVPLLVGGGWPECGGRHRLREIGHSIAAVIRDFGRPVLIVASSDLNHYEDQETSRVKDRLVLEALTRLDAEALMDRVRDVDVSMCGVGPAYIATVAARQLGATRGEVLEYRTSGDVSGDFNRVVGYGGVVME